MKFIGRRAFIWKFSNKHFDTVCFKSKLKHKIDNRLIGRKSPNNYEKTKSYKSFLKLFNEETNPYPNPNLCAPIPDAVHNWMPRGDITHYIDIMYKIYIIV